MSSADLHEQIHFNSASSVPAVEDCELFREDIFRKKLMDLAGHPHATTCCPITATLATMLKTHVYLHTPQYGYMRAYQVQFVSIVKKQVVVKVPTNELLALSYDDASMGGDMISEWLSDTNAKDGNLCFQSISWTDARSCCHSLVSPDGSPTLSVLMSDGNLIFFDRCHGFESFYELALSSSYYHLRLYGVRVLFDPTVDYLHWCLKRASIQPGNCNIGLPLTSSNTHIAIRDRIRCYCVQSFVIGSEGCVTTILVVGSCNSITVWRVTRHGGGDSRQQSSMEIVCDQAIDPNMEYGVEAPLPTALSMHIQSSRSVEELSFTLMCSTSGGDVLMFRIDIRMVTTGKLDAIISGPSSALSIFRTPIDRMVPMETPSHDDNHRLASGLVLVTAISGSRSALIAVDISRHYMQLCQCISMDPPATSNHYLHCTTITGWTDLPSSCGYPRRLTEDLFDPRRREVLASFSNGLLQHYQYTLIPCDGGCTVSYSMSLLEWGEDSIKLSNFLFGVATDPLGLVCPYLQKVSANLSHSRESQLNLALTKPHCDLMFQLCPQIDDQFAGYPLLLSQVLSYVVHHSSAKCFSFLPLAFLCSLEQCRAVYREHLSPDAADNHIYYHNNDGINGNTSSIIHGKEEAEVSVESDDDDGSSTDAMQEDSDSDSNSSIGPDYPGVAQKPRKVVPPPPPSRGRGRRQAHRTRTSGLTSLYRSFLERKRPDSASLVVLSTRNLFIAALVVSRAINTSSGPTAEEECSIEAFSTTDWTLSDPSITQSLLYFPSDPLLLRKKVRLWQCVHLTVLAGHKTRDVTITEECRDLLSRLRTCMSVAAAIASLQRVFGAGIDHADGVCVATLCSLYFQTQLVRSFSPTTLSGDLRESMIDLCDAALASDAMRDMDRRREALEHCAACGSSLLFDCNSTDDCCSRDAAHASSHCSGCGLTTERCCFSLRVITSMPEEAFPLESSVVDNRQQDRNHRSSYSSATVLSCPVCGAVTSVALLRDFHQHRMTGCETSSNTALCPFCTVWMLPI